MCRPSGIKYSPADNRGGPDSSQAAIGFFLQQPITDAEPSLILGLDSNMTFSTSHHLQRSHLYFYLFPIFINIIIIQKKHT